MNVVIIPAIGRPGFTAITLGLIASSKGFKGNIYLFALDLGHHTGLHEVIEDFVELYDVEYKIITPNKRYPKPGKQSFNIINAYREALKMPCNFVHLIENDIFVSNDYFNWHYGVRLNDPGVKLSIASRNNNSNDRTIYDLEAYYLKQGDYQSLGVCWNTDLLEFVLSFVEDWYFEDPVAYCRLKFPDSKIGPYFAEQDGLIRRILEFNNIDVAFPHVPRCFHAGFEGYNRFGKETLPESTADQIEMIRRIAFRPETMKANTYHPEHYYDSIPIKLDLPQWKKQKLVSLSQ